MTLSSRQAWRSQAEFVYASSAMSVGLSNLWMFPYVVYENGGVVFMMVYGVLIATVGVPMVYLELFLGQFSSCTVPRALGCFPMAKGIGWAMILVTLVSTVNYTGTLANFAFYLYYSFSEPLAFTTCKNRWNDANCYEKDYRNVPCFRINSTLWKKYSSHSFTGPDALVLSMASGNVSIPRSEYETMRSTCLNVTQSSTEQFLMKRVVRLSSGIEELGGLHEDTLQLLMLCWFLLFLAIVRGIRSFTKVALCTMSVVSSLLSILLLTSLVQRGSLKGLAAYFRADWVKVVDLKTWRAGSQHLLFSMGAGMGTLTCYGSYNPFDWPLSQNVMKLAAVDFFFSFITGCMVFGLFGHTTILYGMDFDEVVTAQHQYIFVTFPESVKHFTYPQLWCVAFYLTAFLLIFSTMAAFVEVLITSAMDSYPTLQPHRLGLTAATCFSGFALSLPAATQGGPYVQTLLDIIMYRDLLPWIALAEVVMITNGYGTSRITHDIDFMTGKPPPPYIMICLRYICPLALVAVSLGSVSTDRRTTLGYTYPAWTGIIELGTMILCMVMVITQLMRTMGENRNDIYAALEAEETYGPADPKKFELYQLELCAHNVHRTNLSSSKSRCTRGRPTTLIPNDIAPTLSAAPAEQTRPGGDVEASAPSS